MNIKEILKQSPVRDLCSVCDKSRKCYALGYDPICKKCLFEQDAQEKLDDAKKTRDASKHRLEREIMDLDNFVRVKGIANLKVERALNENKERN